MRVPDWWQFTILAFGAYRLTRLGGWDEWPLAARFRAWVTGEQWVPGDDVALPGKTPESEVDDVRVAYRRPTLAHLIHCPFCLGWWVSLAVYVFWLCAPTAALYALVPFALSGVVGLISKNWDG